MKRQRLRRLLSVLLAALLLMSSVAVAGAAPAVPNDDDALQLMLDYGLVKGDQFGNLNLNKPITRAEASTVFVRVMGQESTAALLADIVPFSDAKGHWAAGYIAVAQRLGLMKGRSETIFDPEAQINNQELYTVILRLVKREPLGPWNPAQIMQIAASLGLTPSNIDLSLLGSAPAVRGTIFNGLGKAVAGVELPDGKTVLSTYTDSTPPTLKLDNLPTSTGANSIKITGTAEGAHVLMVNNQQYRLTNGRFSIDVPLQSGNNALNIAALDWAGNQATQTVRIARASKAATIIVAGDLAVKAGQTAPLQAIAYDADGIALAPTEVSATVSGNLGRYDAATGKFTANNTAGTGTITFKAGDVTETADITVLGVATNAKSLQIKGTDLSGSLNKNTTVTVEVLDGNGNPITYDDGRTVSLVTTGLTGARVLNATAVTSKGVATFTVTSTEMGEATLTAAANGLTNAVGSLVFASSTRIKLAATSSSATADGVTPVTIRATLVDENGKEVFNTSSSDLYISLSADSTDSGFSNPLLIIRRNTTSSAGNDASLVPGFKTETVRVTGKVTSGQNYTVLPTTVSFKEIVVGSVSKLDLVGGGGIYTPGSGANVTVRAADKDSNMVPQGTYAFQLEATTSNNEPIDSATGLPAGLEIYLMDGLTPTGSPLKGTTYVGRTKNGFANVRVSYNKSGVVTVKLVASPATAKAYDSTGEEAAASASSSFTMGQATILFSSPVKKLNPVVLTPNAGATESHYGVLPANGSASLKVRVYLEDLANGRIPNGAGLITLTRSIDGGATTATATSATAINGYAEFTIRATSTIGTDEWKVTYGSSADVSDPAKPHATFTVQTSDTSLPKANILSMYGETNSYNRLAVADTYLTVTVSEVPGGTGNYGYANFYRSGSSTPIWRSEVVDLGVMQSFKVPRSAFPTNVGSDRYTVEFVNGKGALSNGLGKSDLYPNDGSTVIIEQSLKINISKVQYDATTDRIYVSASNLDARYGMINGAALTIRSSLSGVEQGLGGASCTITNSSTFTCSNVGVSDLVSGFYLGDFFGDVTLITDDGWYRNDNNGQSAPQETTAQLTDNLINPLSSISDASFVTFDYDPTTGAVTGGKLTLMGSKLNVSGTQVDLSQINFAGTIPLTPASGNGVKIDSRTDTAIIISLGTLADDIAALAAPTITVNKGWIYTGSGSARYVTPGLSARNVYVAAKITSIKLVPAAGTDPARLEITGSGFKNGAVSTAFLASAMKYKKGSAAAVGLPIVPGSEDVNSNGTKVTFDVGDITALMTALTTSTSTPTYFVGEDDWGTNGSGWTFAPVVNGRIRITK